MDSATRDFAWANRNCDVAGLLLGRHEGVDLRVAARQIEGLQMARAKWPSLLECRDFQFPPRLNCEQSSSEATAGYKAATVDLKGLVLADLTGGMGVDTMAFAKVARTVHYVERDPQLCALAEANFGALGLTNVVVHCGDAAEWLRDADGLDVVFADPARRDRYGRKVAAFEHCEPDIVALLPLIKQKCSRLVVKASPMIDLWLGASQLGPVDEMHVVAVGGECKEVLYVTGIADEPAVVCANIGRSGTSVERFTRSDENRAEPLFTASAGRYLYEPNAALMKGGCFRLICQRYGVAKLDRNTHLYTSDVMVDGFPGRVFEVEAQAAPAAKVLRPLLPEGRASVICRNYPLEAEQLRKKLGLADGGDKCLVATTLAGAKVAFICRLVRSAAQ